LTPLEYNNILNLQWLHCIKC